MHHFPSLGLRSFWLQHVRYGRGARAFRRRHGTSVEFDGYGFYWQLAAGAFKRGWRVGLLVMLAQLATAVGYADGWRRERRAGVAAGIPK